MAQLTDILIGSTLPPHPRFGKNPWASLQLVQGEKSLDETQAVAGDENGIWEIESPINLPDTDQSLTLAVVVHSQDSKRRLVSATFRIESIFAQLKASPNQYYEFITCDSCASLQVILSFSIKKEACNILETLPPHPVADVNRYLAHEETTGNEQKLDTGESSPVSREDLRNAYTKLANSPNSDDKWERLSNIGRAHHTLYQKGRDVEDLDNAISIQREAVNLGYSHPQLAQHLWYLSSVLERRYDHRGNRADIDEAIQAAQKALGLTQRNAPERANLLMQLAFNYNTRFERLGDVADADMAVLTYSEGVALMPEGSPNKAMYQSNLAGTYFRRFERLGVIQDLERAISNLENAVRLTPDGHPQKPSLYNNLGGTLEARFSRLGNFADLNNAISNSESAVNLMPDGHPDKPSCYSSLGIALRSRFKRLGDLADLNNAISNHENAVRLTPDGHPQKPSLYNNLGDALKARFSHLGNFSDLNNAISNSESAVSLMPDGHLDKPVCYGNLGSALLSRFRRLSDLADLNKAISNLESAVSLTPDGHSDKPSYHNDLGGTLEARFSRLGNFADLNNAISNSESAVNLMPDGHPDKPSCYSSLGIALQSRFKRLGDPADLNKAIYNHENSVRLTPDNHPDKPSNYSRLGIALRSRFERLGDPADLNKAISNHENAVSLTSDSHPYKPSHYSNLGNAFQSRFWRLGDLADLNKAISNHENAVSLAPDDYPDKYLCYENLGISLLSRFRRLSTLADLEMAVSNQESAVSLMPDDHPDKPSRYCNLGIALRSRFERLGDPADLNKAISNHENAVGLTPDNHPDRPSHYSSLGIALRSRFERLGDLADLNKAIYNHENAVSLTSDSHPDKPSHYNNLGMSFLSRFEHLGTLVDLERAISNQEHAVSLKPDEQPDKVSMTFNLAKFYERRFLSTAKISNLDLAHSLYATAAQSPVGYPQQRFKAAVKWVHYARLTNNSPLPAYRCAIDQLPRIAWLGIPLGEQYLLLDMLGWVVRDAVAAAIEVEEYEMAVEWTEQGRSIVWQNLLKLRTPVDDLRTMHPEIASQLQSISQQLDPSGSREFESQTREDMQPQKITESHSSLAIAWDETVDQIRQLPHFETFLKPKTFDNLVPAAHEGSVVILNVTNARCDALTLIPGGYKGVSVVSIPLKSFSLKQSEKLLLKLTILLRQVGVRNGETRKPTQNPRNGDAQKEFKLILKTLWVGVVRPVLDGLAYQPRTSDLPRIWWCVTGPLSSLPIHAAGDYDVTEPGHKVSDYVVSSYTPTLTAILDSSYPIPSNEFKLLAVAQPSAPGYSTIPKTVGEVEQIAKVATCVSVVILTKEAATVERVQKEMRESHWVHLACHGKQDASKPIESGLILYDGTLKLSTIIKESLPKANFAFLSACQTAMGEQKVAEESVHLAAGMLLAGYKSVIATMWSIKDNIAPQVTELVYSRMLKDGNPDRREAAHALHEAVKQLRESGVDFTSWVPFIHIGR